MPIINVAETFEFSEDTLSVKTFEPGHHEVSDLCANYAQAHGFLEADTPVEDPKEAPVEVSEETPVEAAKPKGKK